MSSLGIAAVVFGCVFASSMLGMRLRDFLPESHRSPASQDVVKLGTGLIATMAALVLGLLISSAKSSFDTIDGEMTQNAAKVVRLDRMLADYGPDAREIRELVKRSYAARVERLFPRDAAAPEQPDSARDILQLEGLRAKLWALSPQSESQQWLRTQSVQAADEITSAAWLLLMQREEGLPSPLIVVLVFWLSIIFAAFGLFAPRNATVVVALLVCSLSVSGAILLIEEMDSPLSGMMKLSPAPMRRALADLGQ